MVRERNILQGFKHFFTDEKKRGMLTSLVNGGIVSTMNYVGVIFLGLSAPMSTLIFMYVIGSFLGYSLDIMFAKADFVNDKGVVTRFPYADLKTRLQWLIKSYADSPFVKFLVASIIETLTAIAILRAIIIELDRRDVIKEHSQYRNLGVALLVTTIVFLLFGNILRFDWAYSNVENMQTNISVLMWMALSVLIFSLVHVLINAVQSQSETVKETTAATVKEDDDATAEDHGTTNHMT